MSIKSFFSNYFQLGSTGVTNKTELKKIILFNVFCFGWQILSIIMIIDEYKEHTSFSVILLGICMSAALVIIQYVHYKQYFLLGRILYLLLFACLTFWFANYLFKKNLLEFYFFMMYGKSLIFINSKRINYTILIIAFGLFFIPNFYYNHYPISMFNDVSIAFLFFAIFIMINNFKSLNAKNEAELESKKNDLEKINEFQSQFFINISHEIRTPLTLIRGQIDKLKQSSLTPNEISAVENGVNIQVDKIKKMVDDVLDLAKMETSDFKLNLKTINLKKVVHKISLHFEPLFKEKNIDFKVVSESNFFIKSDVVYLERAVNNIILNALKYTDRNGTVSVILDEIEDNAVVKIKDSGIGLSEKDQKKIFERFYQADNSINKSGGSGVGLAFSKEIIELHNGTLEVESELTIGSTFTITLPKTEEEILETTVSYTSKPKILPQINLGVASTSYQFLIVDDNTEMRAYLKEIFSTNKCLEVENGLEALEILNNHEIDFIITDYMMPKMNGLEFIQNVKPKYPNIPIIMLTARADSKSKLDVLQLGIDDYLEKPFNKDELIIRVNNSIKNYEIRAAYRQTENISVADVKTDNWTIQVKEYISKNSDNTNLTQEDIAEQFNLSKSSLYRKIKLETGLTPREFITEVKLQKARSLLESNYNISLKQLSLEVGFLHNSYFSKLFKNRFGISPTDFSKARA